MKTQRHAWVLWDGRTFKEQNKVVIESSVHKYLTSHEERCLSADEVHVCDTSMFCKTASLKKRGELISI